MSRGQQWWSGAEGNYWGHNAIIRVVAFAESARLPHLSGPSPWGGHILSHDFVEAAFLRRRGWAVKLDASLAGSYEESPPTLLDLAARDRRWCQGNLQHARLVSACGLHWVSRLHLLLGIFTYLAPPMWLALVACSALVWPHQDLRIGSSRYEDVLGLLVLSVALLAAPKLLALLVAMRRPELRARFGGARRLLSGFAAEFATSIVLTPLLMVMQSVAVVEVLLGRDGGWKPQQRRAAGLSAGDAWRAHRPYVAAGAAGLVGALLVDPYLLIWVGPVFFSLTFSAALSWHTSRPGRNAERQGDLSDDGARAPSLAALIALRASLGAEPEDPDEGLAASVADDLIHPGLAQGVSSA